MTILDTIDINGIDRVNAIIKNVECYSLIWYFPYLGHNEKYGGWPEILFKMSWLRELNFGYQGITLVPTELKSMAKLEHVDLQYCPLLETLSSKLGLMNNLNGQ